MFRMSFRNWVSLVWQTHSRHLSSVIFAKNLEISPLSVYALTIEVLCFLYTIYLLIRNRIDKFFLGFATTSSFKIAWNSLFWFKKSSTTSRELCRDTFNNQMLRKFFWCRALHKQLISQFEKALSSRNFIYRFHFWIFVPIWSGYFSLF